MKGKEDLYFLIRAMTPSEKRYFTLDAQKSGRKASRYLELFHLINGMEQYDEEVLKRRFPRSLPFDKGYLYDAILRAMRDYRSSKSRSAQIKERLLDARYLFERSLYSQCEVRLEEARQLAEELEDHLVLLELNKEFRRLVLGTKQPGFEERLQELAAEEQILLEAIREELQYLKVYESLAAQAIKRFVLRGREEKARFRKELPEDVLRSGTPPKTSLARLRYYQSLALYHQLIGEFEEVITGFSEVVDWWDRHPVYKEEEFYRYLMDFSNLLHAYAANGQLQLLRQLLVQLESTQPDTETARRILFQRVSIYRLITYINLGIKEGVDELVDEIADGLDKFNIQAATRSALLSNVAFLMFIRGRFGDCLVWCGRLIGDRKNKYRQDIRTAIYLLQLVAAFELDDLQLLEGVYRSTYRYMKKNNRLEKDFFEKRMLDYIRRLMTEPPDTWREIWENLQAYLKGVHQDDSIKVSHGMDELLLLWVASKLARKPIFEMEAEG